MSYAREIKMPDTRKEGLCNFVQMVINRLEAGDHREALLTAVGLLDDLSGCVYEDVVRDLEVGRDLMPMAEHFEAVRAAEAAAFQKGFEAGRKAKASEYRKLIGEAA